MHGGGPQIGAMLERLGLKSRFVDGLRVTDAATMEVAEMVLSGLINKELVTAISQAGGTAIGLSGKDANLIRARKLSAKEDLGFVGEPAAVRADTLHFLASSQMIPVIAPIGAGPNGESYNINADTVAGAIAGAAKAKRLILLTDVAGVLDKDKKLVPHMTAAETRARIADGTITDGMIPESRNLPRCCDQRGRGGGDHRWPRRTRDPAGNLYRRRGRHADRQGLAAADDF